MRSAVLEWLKECVRNFLSALGIEHAKSGVGSSRDRAPELQAEKKAVLSQREVGAGSVSGGGPMARSPRLIGQGRALEVLLERMTSATTLPSATAKLRRAISAGLRRASRRARLRSSGRSTGE